MRVTFKLLAILVFIFALTSAAALPASAEVTKGCVLYPLYTLSPGNHPVYYDVNTCLKIEYLPGGVRGFMAFDCYSSTPSGTVDQLCNYELINLKLYQGSKLVAFMPYAHKQNSGYYLAPPTPWFPCHSGSTKVWYTVTFEKANVRAPNGKVYPLKPYLYQRQISCS